MTWEQKLEAMQTLFPVCLRMRKPGDWYVDPRGREIGGDGILRGVYGSGNSPEAAVNDDWRQCVEELRPGLYLSKNAYSGSRTQWRWTGCVWQAVPVEGSA